MCASFCHATDGGGISDTRGSRQMLFRPKSMGVCRFCTGRDGSACCSTGDIWRCYVGDLHTFGTEVLAHHNGLV
ncbi:hypothetical protein MPTK1_4g19960 [Marchantia polymorpha subsp. ruderalis]|uniref:Uncharacterized protein n=2 Tax=Marchantia polymorpha TaxID=3197 RepID=A0AAF6BBT4_MARPO|nr:hypothetical protein MARPO_2045s0001 [Marchantia polymorpha]BBN09468.1 hypothetical protein Mp_4g19960 [Marchantia polymorpha subsp. ruderalis]|eukprot:PTQ26395.1 hypothetical protein MARPO_2045s0001 [Marchantia polymorpha]